MSQLTKYTSFHSRAKALLCTPVFDRQRFWRDPEERHLGTKLQNPISSKRCRHQYCECAVLGSWIKVFHTSPCYEKQGNCKVANDFTCSSIKSSNTLSACAACLGTNKTDPKRTEGWYAQTQATLICYSQTFWVRIKLNAWQAIEGPGAARCPLVSMCSSPFVSCLIFLRRDRLQAQALSPPPSLHKSPPLRSPHLAYAGSAQLGKQGTKDKKTLNKPRRRLSLKEMETGITYIKKGDQ